MKLNQELIDTLQAIHDGKPWEYRYRLFDGRPWEGADNTRADVVLLPGLGYEIRLKPEAEIDPYAKLKAAHAAGETIEHQLSDGTWVRADKPTWLVPPERYRIKPKPEPDPYAEAKAAWQEGELQYRDPFRGTSWSNWSQKCEPAWISPPSCYRRKPKPVRVPLDPEDVPPGSVFRHPQWAAASYRVPKEVNEYGVGGIAARYHAFKDLMDDGWLINRPNKRFASSGMPSEWEPCWKEVQP